MPVIRIGFVSVQNAAEVQTWSGIPAQVLQSLQRLNVHVELYSPLSQRKKYLLAPLKALARVRKSSISLDHFPLMLNSYAIQISRAIRERPVDVIVSTSSIPVAALDCTQPIIFWSDAVFHGMYDYYGGSFSGMSVTAIQRAKRQEEAALDNCTFAAYASEWAAASARKLTDPPKIQVLPFGASFAIHHTRLDLKRWVRGRLEERTGEGRLKRCELLFIGVDWKRKGGAIAVETTKILNEIGIPARLTIVGCRPPSAMPNYVRVLGFISKATTEGSEQLQSLLREADFFILPTLAEAAGTVFCEASAFGLPTLSYATGGVPDYVRDDVNGVCLPVGTSAVEFAHAVRGILQDANRYETLCLRAFNEYETRLNWDNSTRILLDLCHRALRKAPLSVHACQGKLGAEDPDESQ